MQSMKLGVFFQGKTWWSTSTFSVIFYPTQILFTGISFMGVRESSERESDGETEVKWCLLGSSWSPSCSSSSETNIVIIIIMWPRNGRGGKVPAAAVLQEEIHSLPSLSLSLSLSFTLESIVRSYLKNPWSCPKRMILFMIGFLLIPTPPFQVIASQHRCPVLEKKKKKKKAFIQYIPAL